MMRPTIIHNAVTSEYYFDERCHITELSNSSADPALSVARARVAPGVTTRWHRLNGVTERYVVLKGTGRVEIDDYPPESVASGDVVLIPPGCPQRIVNTGEGELVFLALCTPRFQLSLYEDLEAVVHP